MPKQHETSYHHPKGTVVFAKERPEIPMVVRRYVDRIYYCTNQQDSSEREKVYFLRELV